MNVLVACEFSGVVRNAFTARGHNAWSCDLLPAERAGNHHCGDVLEILDWGWDLMIAHPPCTYLSNAGGHYLKTQEGRMKKMKDGAGFFLKLLNAPIPKIAIENPIQHGPARKIIRKYDQIVQPYHFGQAEKKTVCLWLKDLPKLQHTNVVEVKPKGKIVKSDGRNYYYWYHQGKSQKERSRFFTGIADAMADQWG